jgi:hypothetical protein
MTDTLLHCLLGLALLFAFHAAVLLLGPMLAAALIAGFTLYFREVTQNQAKNFGFDFRRGWNPAKWSAGKNFETWIPVSVVLCVAAAIEFGAQ